MKKSRFTESQIIKAVKEHKSGRNVNELCRELGIHQGTFYTWKKKYGGMEIQELKVLRVLRLAQQFLHRKVTLAFQRSFLSP